MVKVDECSLWVAVCKIATTGAYVFVMSLTFMLILLPGSVIWTMLVSDFVLLGGVEFARNAFCNMRYTTYG